MAGMGSATLQVEDISIEVEDPSLSPSVVFLDRLISEIDIKKKEGRGGVLRGLDKRLRASSSDIQPMLHHEHKQGAEHSPHVAKTREKQKDIEKEEKDPHKKRDKDKHKNKDKDKKDKDRSKDKNKDKDRNKDKDKDEDEDKDKDQDQDHDKDKEKDKSENSRIRTPITNVRTNMLKIVQQKINPPKLKLQNINPPKFLVNQRKKWCKYNKMIIMVQVLLEVV